MQHYAAFLKACRKKEKKKLERLKASVRNIRIEAQE